MSTARTYLKTLRRIPDDIVLSMATREINPYDNATCVCGWAIREAIARTVGADAANVTAPMFADARCAERFGGSDDEWFHLFDNIQYEPEVVESAFARRVMEAAKVRA